MFNLAKNVNVAALIGTIRYYSGWAGKIQG